jgi:GT2 family glycosyltransferase
LNYDIDFDKQIFVKLLDYIQNNSGIALIMPKVLNKNNSYQWLPKLQPTIFSILKRKLFKLSNYSLFKSFVRDYEFREINPDLNYNIPNLSGCFLLLNIDLIKHEGLFDERFFLYFEDYDLSRRLTSKYQTVLNNHTFVIHDYQSLANKNLLHIYIFIKSLILFFNKWGWYNSKKLKSINQIYKVN